MFFCLRLSPCLKSVQHDSARSFIFTECWHSSRIGGRDLDEVPDHREDTLLGTHCLEFAQYVPSCSNAYKSAFLKTWNRWSVFYRIATAYLFSKVTDYHSEKGPQVSCFSPLKGRVERPEHFGGGIWKWITHLCLLLTTMRCEDQNFIKNSRKLTS